MCPECGNDNLSKIAGIEVPGVYDGALFWQCLACHFAWQRWPEGDRRFYAAREHIDAINAR